ncbi:hypothetical protein Tco_1327395 [Tanacetum coccineum]
MARLRVSDTSRYWLGVESWYKTTSKGCSSLMASVTHPQQAKRSLRIMPPRRLKKKSIKRLVEKRVAKAIEEYEKSRANLDSAGSSGGNPGNA